MSNLRKILEELVFKYIPHDGVYAESDIDLAHQQILALIPKKKVVNEYNLSPNPDMINDTEVRRQSFNQAISEITHRLEGV